jgi:DNA-binding MarR family transcriptional regulator
VTTAPRPEDKRSRLLTLTDDGHALLARALPIWREEHAALDRLLAEHDAA